MRHIISLTKFFALISILLVLTSCSTTRRPVITLTPVQPQKPLTLQPLPPPRVVLVLGAGSTRGIAEVGVLKALQAKHIPIDLIVGTDAGSIVGALYAGNQDVPKLQRTLLHTQLSTLINVSALHALTADNGPALQHFIVTHVRARYFSQLPIRFAAVATDLSSGESVALNNGAIAPAVNASCALPPYFRPVQLYGRTLVNGLMTDPIAVDVAKTYQPKIIIAVDISANLTKQMPSNIIGTYERGYQINQEQFDDFTAEGADVIIRPNSTAIEYPTKLQNLRMIWAGEAAANAALPQICALLQKNKIISDCSPPPAPMPLVKPPKQTINKKIMQYLNQPINQLKTMEQNLERK